MSGFVQVPPPSSIIDRKVAKWQPILVNIAASREIAVWTLTLAVVFMQIVMIKQVYGQLKKLIHKPSQSKVFKTNLDYLKL